MAVPMNSFHITDMIYNSDNQTITYKFYYKGNLMERVGVGFTTDEDIVDDFQKILDKYFAKS